MARSLSPVARAGVLAGVLSLAFAVAVPIALNAAGWDGVAAAGCAALLCLAAGVAVIVLTLFASSPEHVAYLVVLGMLLRMGIPLVSCLAIYYRGGWLVDGGMVYYLLVFYPLTVAAETWLDVTRLSPPDFAALQSEPQDPVQV